MWRVTDCKVVAGEHATTQHKPVVFVVWMERRREVKSRGRRNLRCQGNVVIKYKERVRARYDKLCEEVEGLEEEWKKPMRGVLRNYRSFVWKDIRKRCIVKG